MQTASDYESKAGDERNLRWDGTYGTAEWANIVPSILKFFQELEAKAQQDNHGHIHVTMPRGGTLHITPKEINMHVAPNDHASYAALAVLLRQMGETGEAHGSKRHQLMAIAHGMAHGVKITGADEAKFYRRRPARNSGILSIRQAVQDEPRAARLTARPPPHHGTGRSLAWRFATAHWFFAAVAALKRSPALCEVDRPARPRKKRGIYRFFKGGAMKIFAAVVFAWLSIAAPAKSSKAKRRK